MIFRIVSPDWLARPAPVVAPELVGCVLARRLPSGDTMRGVIVETEAYTQDDPACHGYKGPTPARWAIFAAPGLAYVYLTYGMYHCFNVVTDRENYASAVLVRAVAIDGVPDRAAAGPGKLCRVLDIDRRLNGVPLHPDSGLWLEPATASPPLVATTRIGITRGVDLPWRWYWRGHAAVSKK